MSDSSNSISSDLFAFIKKPEVNPSVTPLTVSSFFVLLILSFILVFAYSFLLNFLGAGPGREFDNVLGDMIAQNPFWAIFMAVIVAPIIEEIVFRYHLTLEKKSIIWSMVVCLIFFFQVWVVTIAFMVYLLYLLISVWRGSRPSLAVVIYVSAIFFGIVHLANYRDFEFLQHFYWIPVLIFIQFAMGLILSFIMVHYGLFKAILFHAAYNGALLIPAIIFA